MNRDLRLAVRIGAVFAAVLLVCYLWLPLPTVVAQTSVSGGGGGAATSVTAAAFPLRAPDGTAVAPSYSFTNATGAGILLGSSANGGHVTIAANGVEVANFNPSQAGMVVTSGNWIGWVAGADANAAFDSGLARTTTSVVKAIGTGSGTDGWIQNAAGDKYNTGDVTNATTTFANLTDLSITVVSARNYVFDLKLFVADSTAADGIKIDFNGGSAGATTFRTSCYIMNDAGSVTAMAVSISTALATAMNAGSMSSVNQHVLVCHGYLLPSGNGTFIPRQAQQAHTTGTLTTFKGSHLLMKDMP